MIEMRVVRCLVVAMSVAALGAPAFSQCQDGADLLLYKTGPAEAPADSDVAYSVTVFNQGPCAASAVVLSDPIPGTMTFVSQSQDSGPAASCAALTPGVGGTVSCSIPTLLAGASASFTLLFHIPVGTDPLTYFLNVATVSSEIADPDPENNSASATTGTPPPPTADVGIEKTAPPAAGPGTDVVWSLLVTNGGPDNATGVSLQDVLPAPMTFVSLTQTSGPTASCTTPAVGAGGTVSCSIATLPAAATASFALVTHVPAGTTSGTSFANTATVSSDTETVPDPNEENQSSTAEVVVSAVDVSIVKTGPATAAAGSNASYVLTVANAGPDAATGVQFTDALPPGTTFVSLTQNTGPEAVCSTPAVGSNGAVACIFTSLANGASAQFTLTLNTGGATSYTNTASVTTSSFDSDTANNSSAFGTAVTQSADLAVTKGGPASVTAGGNVSYTVSIGNNGPSAAANATLTDALPAGTSFVSLSQTNGPPFGCTTPAVGASGTISCSIATLPPASVATFTVVLSLANTAAGTLANTARAGAATADPTANNNDSTVSSAILAAPVVVIPTLSPIAIGLLGLALAATALALIRR